MLLNDYLNKLKSTNLKELNKPWLNSDIVNNDFLDNVYPDHKTEEWKNFNLKNFIDKKWKLLESQNSLSFKKENISSKNLIVFNNGVLEKKSTKINIENKIKIYSLNEYYNKDNTLANKIYSDSNKYSENRISGIVDYKTTSLLSLNSLLNHGVVIEVSSESKVEEEICIYNQISTKCLSNSAKFRQGS